MASGGYVPHKQVGHMAAPTSVAEAPKTLAKRRAVHTGSTVTQRSSGRQLRLRAESSPITLSR
jgi:hypothetical protein